METVNDNVFKLFPVKKMYESHNYFEQYMKLSLCIFTNVAVKNNGQRNFLLMDLKKILQYVYQYIPVTLFFFF